MKVSIYEKKYKETGKTSLLLITQSGASRTKKSLGLYFKTNPATQQEREDRTTKRTQARQIALNYEQEFIRGNYDIPVQYKTGEDFFRFAWNYVDSAEASTIEVKKYVAMLRRLAVFVGKKSLAFYELTPQLVEQFTRNMEANTRGETSRGYLSRLKIILKAAVREGYIKANPAADVTAKQMGKVEKAVLTLDELLQLKNTPLDDDHTRRAFLFCTYTALRFCDVKELKWSNIKGNNLHFRQSKTGYEVMLPLIPEALELLGKRREDAELVFELRTHATTCKNLKRWAQDAGIEKVVTFHVARHSSATNLVAKDVNLAIASKILGHRNLSMTQRYIQISDASKEAALMKLSLNSN